MRSAAHEIALVGLVAGALSCASSSPSNPADSGASDSTFGCKADVRAQTYSANMQKPGMAGSFTFALVSASPAPPARGDNIWVLKVLDQGGSPVKDATFPPQATWAGWPVGVLPSMPDHGHRSPAQPTVTPNSDGTYRIEPLFFSMPGLWQITINVLSGSTTDSAQFSFCIEG